jgi:8-oxo-dGTP pyrophosphatase MutT (NUDIX family)
MSKSSSTRNTSSKPIQDASTVILLRESAASLETFMMCRHSKSGFMGGAHVFPGGKVDVADRDETWESRLDTTLVRASEQLDEPDLERTKGFWVAAVRETFEEAGVLLARATDSFDPQSRRARLRSGSDFLELAGELDLQLSAADLTPYARWVTPDFESQRFDTCFFVAVLPSGQDASHDGTETTSATWLEPAAALQAMQSRTIKLAPPTVRTLQWLSDFERAADVISAAAGRKPPLVRPELVQQGEGWFLALPGDPDHSEQEPVLPGSTRMLFDHGVWRDH